ncbi:MAG: sulfur transferase domain-containing protein [Moraxella sp.]|nr:sulfur transferase domain-containing protein [Moraxella sp.]
MHSDITLYKQIHPCQCQSLAKLGYKSLINLRFDNECDNQPSTDELGQSAKAFNLAYSHLPIDMDNLHLDTVEQFAKLVHDLPKPVMVFCGTGNRAKLLYQSAVVSGLV